MLFFSIASELVIVSLQRQHLLILRLQCHQQIFGPRKYKICPCFYFFPFSACHEMMGPSPPILQFFECWVLSDQAFGFPLSLLSSRRPRFLFTFCHFLHGSGFAVKGLVTQWSYDIPCSEANPRQTVHRGSVPSKRSFRKEYLNLQYSCCGDPMNNEKSKSSLLRGIL